MCNQSLSGESDHADGGGLHMECSVFSPFDHFMVGLRTDPCGVRAECGVFSPLVTPWLDSTQIHADSAQSVRSAHRSTRTLHSPCGVHTNPRGVRTVRADPHGTPGAV